MEERFPSLNKGGFELSPTLGHLGGREPMVKPTLKWVGFCVLKGGDGSQTVES
jgi:hypothetical protein